MIKSLVWSQFIMRIGAFVLSALALTACLGAKAALDHEAASPITASVAAEQAVYKKAAEANSIIPVYVATSRAAENKEDSQQLYGIGRSPQLNYVRVNIKVPPEHKKGVLERNERRPNPAKHFTVTSLETYSSQQQFKQALNKALARQPAGKKDILLFIHGYNNSFSKSTFRAAQFTYDYRLDAVIVHYSWPSGGSMGLYLYDKDSADFAHSGLAELLELLAQTNAVQINVIAHSMGSYITMEALRTLSFQKKDKVINRISNLLMAAPDIDVDVFKQQLKDIRHMPKSTAVQVSSKDQALTLSRRITGDHPRIGDGSNISVLRQNGIAVIDMSDINSGSHHVFATSPALLTLIRNGTLSRKMLADDTGTP